MKKVVKCLLLFTLCFLLLFNSTSFADSPNIEKVTSTVYGLLFKFGVILAVCLTATLAISYMVATPNKKAMLKERLIYYFAGVIFLVGGLAFLNIYEDVSDDVGDTVYANGAPTKIKSYFQNQSGSSTASSGAAISFESDKLSEFDSNDDGKLSASELMDIDDDGLADLVETTENESESDISKEELDELYSVLAYRISSLSNVEAKELDFSALYKHFNELDDAQKDMVLSVASTYSTMDMNYKDDLAVHYSLRDFYRYYTAENKNEDIYGWDSEDWEDTKNQQKHKWYYENVVLNNYGNLWE